MSNNNSPLPPGWRKEVSNEGKPYYFQGQWDDPSVDDPLAFVFGDWKIGATSDGKPFYYRTQWDKPIAPPPDSPKPSAYFPPTPGLPANQTFQVDKITGVNMGYGYPIFYVEHNNGGKAAINFMKASDHKGNTYGKIYEIILQEYTPTSKEYSYKGHYPGELEKILEEFMNGWKSQQENGPDFKYTFAGSSSGNKSQSGQGGRRKSRRAKRKARKTRGKAKPRRH